MTQLILTRLIGDQVNIGDDVHITVLGIVGNQVRLGIDAPQGLPVHREEVYKRIHAKRGPNDAGAAAPASVKVIRRRRIVRPADDAPATTL